MKFFYALYIHFLVWLGAAPPPDYEYLLSADSAKDTSSWRNTVCKNIFMLILIWIITFGLIVFSSGISQITVYFSTYFPTYFPSLNQTVTYHGDGMVIGPTVLFISASLWFLFITLWKLEKNGSKNGISTGQDILPTHVILVLAIGSLGIGSIHFLAVYTEVALDLLFRFDPNKITEIQIERIDAREKCQLLVINDKALINEGFSQLKTAESQWLYRSVFIEKNGYAIKLTFSDFMPHYRYLMVYKESTDRDELKVEVVYPQLFLINNNPGKGFRSPEFHAWVGENIDPHFENCQP